MTIYAHFLHYSAPVRLRAAAGFHAVASAFSEEQNSATSQQKQALQSSVRYDIIVIINVPIRRRTRDMIQLGAAYYPELWDEAELARDIEKCREYGLGVLRVGEFAWGRLEQIGRASCRERV